MKIALIGAKGQLGTALESVLTQDVTPLGHEDVDITRPERVEEALSAIHADIVINAAAYNFVDKAEDEPEVAFAVNALGPRNLATWCAVHDATLLHVSTDHVFSGHVDIPGTESFQQIPYYETDRPDPRSAYSISKLAGEHFVRSISPRHFVVRTCGLYGRSRRETKGNFVTTMLRLAKDRDELTVVNDQRCTPTAVSDLAGWIAALIETDAYGLYHATNSGDATWFEFAQEMFRLAGIPINVQPITTQEFGAKANRPAYSVLNCDKLQSKTGTTLRPWKDALAEYVAQLAAE